MNEDKVRAEFEAWVYNEAARRSYVYMDRVLSRHSNGDYATIWVDMAWIGWKASRAALCVELRGIVTDSLMGMVSAVSGMTPPPNEPPPQFIQSAIDRAISRIELGLGSQGVRTK